MGRGNRYGVSVEEQSYELGDQTTLLSEVPIAKKSAVGWRTGVIDCAIMAAFVLVVNLAFMIWALVRFRLDDGVGTLYTGTCQQLQSLNLWVHLLINILSTGLLSASNYCMQCVCAPTRDDIDKAHAKREWMDIGVPSFRNLSGISLKRRLLWIGLAFSSIPLHLL
jgi:hypothetical protein